MRMTQKEFLEWSAYDLIEGLSDRRRHTEAAGIRQAIANYAGRIADKALPVDAFYLNFDISNREPMIQSEDEMAAIAKAWVGAQ